MDTIDAINSAEARGVERELFSESPPAKPGSQGAAGPHTTTSDVATGVMCRLHHKEYVLVSCGRCRVLFYESKLEQMVVAMLEMRSLPLFRLQGSEDWVDVLRIGISWGMLEVVVNLPQQSLACLRQR